MEDEEGEGEEETKLLRTGRDGWLQYMKSCELVREREMTLQVRVIVNDKN
jgi:hypothetical protein